MPTLRLLTKDNRPHYVWAIDDVFNEQAFVFWTCGCHLRCPFCHNYKIAEGKASCKDETPGRFIEFLEERKRKGYPDFNGAVEYLHFTGGEPLLYPWSPTWFNELRHKLDESDVSFFKISINSSLNVRPELVRGVLDIADHFATDLKWPPERLYGLPEGIARKLFDEYWKRNVVAVLMSGKRLDVRVPVSTWTKPHEVAKVLEEVVKEAGRKPAYVIVAPLISKSVIEGFEVRNSKWPGFKEYIEENERECWKKELEGLAERRVVVRNYFEKNE